MAISTELLNLDTLEVLKRKGDSEGEETAGATFDCAFQRKWCILFADRLATYDDHTQQNRRPDVLLTSRTRVFPFAKRLAPGEALKYAKGTPFGFLIDPDPAEGKRRRIFYFNAGGQRTMEAWVRAIERTVAEIREVQDVLA